MTTLTVVSFTTLDGVVEDPDGRGGTPYGGWAFRYGPEGIAGDKFRLGDLYDTGTLLFGRRTWEHFATLWPTRSGDFADAMNRARKVVLSSTAPDLSAWPNSHHRTGIDDLDGLGDIAVIGSVSVVRALAAAGRVDEYRLITFPVVLGQGGRLFDGVAELHLVSSEELGPTTYAVYRPAAISASA
ncbi:dihydrofolate reductase family protein [Nocardioides mangrovi]|uniref:Dihydrofolate reductase family protein n=1 Tax=Nocardioides mangrovi TaxID=2874580 RepID=A0ABS7UAA4_9ACTN|nr:dihydrofolate reductase family protein [Nocardioides mangrovi]MBZ5737623.1 dihydrofolate reductase family protein [Nocardioides mangrovi]